MDSEDDIDFDNLFGNVTEMERLGFFQPYHFECYPKFDEVIRKLNELLTAPEAYADEDGYKWQMTAGYVDEAAQRAAWVEWKEREAGRVVDVHYYLKARDETGLCIQWEIETYNPYFGCNVGFLKWIDQAVVIIYSEKHHTYAASLQKGAPVKREKLADEWLVSNETIFYRSETPDQVDRLALPALEATGSISAEEALRLNVLPPRYEEGNERRKRYLR